MDTAARWLMVSVVLTLFLGLGVLYRRNDRRIDGMFKNSRSLCVAANKDYYPHIPAEDRQTPRSKKPASRRSADNGY